jgi:DNA polymerase-3 subunit alpha
MPDFVHLHNHSDYSLLDGASTIPNMVARAQELGMRHLALTDHGNMFGVLRFYKECKAAGINPIVGCEFYVASGDRREKSGGERGNRYHHLVLLAKNEEGYKNLMVLTSIGYTEGFYYKPRIDREVLAKHSRGIVALSACLQGEVPQAILNGNVVGAETSARWHSDLFGEGNYFLEMQDHGIHEQRIVNEGLVALSEKTGIPLVVTNDSHYVLREDATAQDILLCIGTNRKRDETNRMRFDSQEFYLKTGDEMARLFGHVPAALDNSVRIAESCNLELHLPGPLLPEFSIPAEFKAPDDYLRHLCYEGLADRYPQVTDEIRDRADYELNIIISMGFTGYFLIVWDFIHWAHVHGVPVGPGRGSGAGSIVAYAMRITDIDPLKYSLLFERFLNPERVSMPDFDIDFCFERRQEVIDYVIRKYGEDQVGQIITFGTLKAKAAVKDVARVLDIPFAESNQITKLIPDGPKVKLKDALEDEKLQEMYDTGGVYKELIDISLKLEGANRHSSTHAAGIVIGKTKLTDYVPLYRDPKTGAISTQFTMDMLEECGLVKMDFLGLKTLTLLKNTADLIRKVNPDFDLETIPEDDAPTFRMLGEGKSAAVFQFESQGMQKILKQARPTNLEDLIALNALYRPGPMANIPQFIDSKHGRTPITYPDRSLEEVLKPTYGVIVYQEQVMQVAQIIGGFSLGKADILRRAMGKKKEKEMEKMKIEFIAGAKERGFDPAKADSIFEMLKPFAGYGFNKSHAAAYSVVAYKTAYCKANYPAEFMAANLTNEINSPDKITDYINEARHMGLEIKAPDINLSEKYFGVVDGHIVYGLLGIKNVGEAAVEEILRVRDNGGPFTDLVEFLERVDLKTVNRKVIETMIQTGVFDELHGNRAQLFDNLDRILDYVSSRKEEARYGQANLFDAAGVEASVLELAPAEEWSRKEQLDYEKQFLGFYFSGHPLDEYKKLWTKISDIDLKFPESAQAEKEYVALGMLRSLRQIITKKGDKMAFGTLEDFRGSVDCVFFPRTWKEIGEDVAEDDVIALKGTVDLSRDEPSFRVNGVLDLEELAGSRPMELHIRLAPGADTEEKLFELRHFLVDGRGGRDELFIHVPNGKGDTVVKAPHQMGVRAHPDYIRILEQHPAIQAAWRE